ncbi:MAG: ABC transporter permease subunit [Firmicutes bacterium]|nr:ABC transporter permease subunit [Bacillota bacterium]
MRLVTRLHLNGNRTSKQKHDAPKTAGFMRYVKKHPVLYCLLIVPLLYLIVFKYVPMYGLIISFMDFNPVDGFLGSKWIGFENFARFFSSPVFNRLIVNTVGISVYQLLAGFPIPIILALSINETKQKWARKSAQMITYAPHFISTVVMVGILNQMLSPHNGVANKLVELLGFPAVNFMGKPEYFKSIFVWSGIWQNMGYSSIIYIAALTSIDPGIQEAAVVDGASKIKRIFYIDLPGIMPTAIILLIVNAGQIMNVGFEKAYLMQNPMNMRTSEIISTYVYQVGLRNGDFGYSTAVGLFNSIVNLVLMLTVNKIAGKTSETSLF